MKQLNDDKQMKDVWKLPAIAKNLVAQMEYNTEIYL
jgi:hypothetical protein